MENNRMSGQQASQYLSNLASSILGAIFTDDSGAELSLDRGSDAAVDLILAAQRNGSKGFVIGNGGSAAIASHVHNDLCKAVGLRSMTFTDYSLLTALANDHGYASVFENPLAAWAEEGDLLIAISSSGRSESILSAVRTARTRGLKVITLSGFSPENPLRRMGHANFFVSAQSYGFVEMAHACLLHYLTDRAGELRLPALSTQQQQPAR